MSGVSDGKKVFIEKLVRYGQGNKILPFYFMGWVACTANTAHDWLSGVLDNESGNFNQVEQITHNGALINRHIRHFHRRRPFRLLEKYQRPHADGKIKRINLHWANWAHLSAKARRDSGDNKNFGDLVVSGNELEKCFSMYRKKYCER